MVRDDRPFFPRPRPVRLHVEVLRASVRFGCAIARSALGEGGGSFRMVHEPDQDTYASIVATRRGGPDCLRLARNVKRPPTTGEARIEVLAVPVCAPDVQARRGQTPFPPRLPFVPGYAVIGDVDACGSGVTAVSPGDRVAALLVVGGYAEYVYVPASSLLPVPRGVPLAEAATLILNYVVAYQTLHRTVGVDAGDVVLILGASGGIGTALLDLGRLAGLTMYGTASPEKHGALGAYGATAIDYRSQDPVVVMRRAEPDGVDAIFDGVGGELGRRSLRALRRGGTLVSFGNPMSRGGLLRLLAWTLTANVIPDGRHVRLYGTGASTALARRRFAEDVGVLFGLLARGDIRPVVHAAFRLLEAAEANALLESGTVIGNVVLLSPRVARRDSSVIRRTPPARPGGRMEHHPCP